MFSKLASIMVLKCHRICVACRGIIIATTQAKLFPPPPQHYCACLWVSSYVCLCFQRSSRQLKYMYSIPYAFLLWGGPNTAPLKCKIQTDFIDICIKISYYFFKNVKTKNVIFVDHIHWKFAQNSNITQNKFHNGVPKNKFKADSKFVETGSENV